MPLTDARQHQVEGIPDGQGALWAVARFGSAGAKIAAAAEHGLAPKAEAVPVYVNEGRWVVDCPDCGGAQLACMTDPRFLCNECGNISLGGRWRRVTWPKDPAAIAAALEPRLPVNRHWLPGETVAQLKRENREHDLAEVG